MKKDLDCRAAFVGHREWKMSKDVIPMFIGAGVTALIHWRPVGVAAWEVVAGEYGMCSLPGFQHAGEAKEDAWAWIISAGVGR